MQHDIPSPNPADESFVTSGSFKKELRSARLKSAGVAFIPTMISISLFMTVLPFKTTLFSALLASFLMTIVPFTLTYQFAFALAFGKNLLPILYKKRKYFERMRYVETDIDSMIDDLNIARGYAPGKGYLGSPEPTRIDWDSHHYR